MRLRLRLRLRLCPARRGGLRRPGHYIVRAASRIAAESRCCVEGSRGMAGETLVERVRQIAERVAASEGMEVVDVEFRGKGGGSLLRIFIDKPGGVTHEDCATISNQVGAILDVEDPVPSSYTLEVSSPGVQRRLRCRADFERFAGKKVRLILKQPVEGQRLLVGRLEGFQNDAVKLTLDRGQAALVPYDHVERANLVFEWKG